MKIVILVEAALFITAALIHFGFIVAGYEHDKARIAESVIAIVLLSGLVLGFIRPAWAHPAGIIVQWFALLGTFVGIFTIVIGVGPRTLPDVVLHLIMIIVLVFGLIISK